MEKRTFVLEPTVEAIPVTADSLIAKVREIGPILRENSALGERERHLAPASYDALKGAGLFRMGKPRAFGGYELDPVSLMKIVEETAIYDTAAGWNLQITTAVALFFVWFSEEGAREVLDPDPDATLAGTLFPPGKATPVAGGYRLSGRWPFASGSQQASWCFGPSFVMDGDAPRTNEDGVPEQIFVTFPAADAEIEDTWHTMGMRGTGSQDVIAKDIFLPERRAAALAPLAEVSEIFDYPLYRMALWTALALLAPPALGVARASIEALVELAKKKTPNYTAKVLRDRSVVQSNIAKAQAVLGSARSYLYESLNQGWESVSAGRELTLEQKGKIQLATSYAVRSAAEAVDLVCEAAGSSAVRLERPFERWFRDVHTMTQHGAASTARYESVGQLMFGLESDWPFFGL